MFGPWRTRCGRGPCGVRNRSNARLCFPGPKRREGQERSMTPPGDSFQNNPRNNALFLTPEEPKPGTGGGGLRSASLLEYLRTKYHVTVASFTLPHHSKTFAARAWRNGWR